MKYRFFCCTVLLVGLLQAQRVQVLTFDSGEPLENVIVYDEAKKTVYYTDKAGGVSLDAFGDYEVISFNHLAYIEYEVLKRDLVASGLVIRLHKKAELLNEIVLSASKEKEKRSRIAEQVAVVFKEGIQDISPQTSADLLATIPGIKVQKSQFGGGSPVLRGMEANRVLLVIDGVRMNNAIYRRGHLHNSITVSPNILDRTEVIFGPSSVIYGSDALGGVIHYYTKTPKPSANKGVSGSFFSRYSSVNNERSASGDLEVINNKWAAYTNISYSKFGDLTMGGNRSHGYEDWGKVFEYSNNGGDFFNAHSVANNNPRIQKNTGFHQTDFLQKFTFTLSPDTQLLFNLQFSQSSNINRFDKLTEYSGDKLKYAEWYYGPQKRWLFSSQLKIHPNKKWLEKGTITAAFQDIEESRIYRKFNSLDRLYGVENVKVFSINGDFFVPLTRDKKRVFSYGFEASHNKVLSDAYCRALEVSGNQVLGFTDVFNIQSRYPDGGSTYSSAAAYLNYRQDINSKTTLNSGIRWVNTYLTAKWLDDSLIALPNRIILNNAALTATFGYVYKPREDWQLNAVISSGFRSPNIDDIGKIREKFGFVSVPNTHLKPEYAYNAEMGVIKYFLNKTFHINWNAYYTLLNNYIVRDYFDPNHYGDGTIMYHGEEGTTIANVNKGTAYITGSTLSIKGTLYRNWFTSSSLTYTKGNTYDTQLPLSSIPPLFGMVEMGFKKRKIQVVASWKFNLKKRLSDYNSIEGIDNLEQAPTEYIGIFPTDKYLDLPAWNILHIRSKYQVNERVSLMLNLDNLFDKHYKEFASSISAPGRNLSLSIFAKW
ncbi:MAG: TonB-dependent receptor [Lutibacter sp.]|nr:TonB-dependent receptor [Lutibacter sp.]